MFVLSGCVPTKVCKTIFLHFLENVHNLISTSFSSDDAKYLQKRRPITYDTVYGTTVEQLGVLPGTLFLCSSLVANSQTSVLIGQKRKLTGCDYGNDMRDATCVERNVLTRVALLFIPYTVPYDCICTITIID